MLTTIHLRIQYPPHPQRESDPFYKEFDKVKSQLRNMGMMKCSLCGSTEDIQLHHGYVEYALQNGVDIDLLKKLHPEFADDCDDDTLLHLIETRRNLMPLCMTDHIGDWAIHEIPYPLWQAKGFWKKDTPLPVTIIRDGDDPHKNTTQES